MKQELTAVQDRELQKALKMLAIVGVPYAVLMPSGEKVGSLEVVMPKPPKPPKAPKPEPKWRKQYKWNHLGVENTVKNAKPGDVFVFPLPEVPDDARIGEKTQSAVLSRAAAVLGSGTVTSMLNRDKRQVELLVLRDAILREAA